MVSQEAVRGDLRQLTLPVQHHHSDLKRNTASCILQLAFFWLRELPSIENGTGIPFLSFPCDLIPPLTFPKILPALGTLPCNTRLHHGLVPLKWRIPTFFVLLPAQWGLWWPQGRGEGKLWCLFWTWRQLQSWLG